MNIIFLSGKGGTGKTLVSTNLAALIQQGNYYDCDVEEPNGHLFLKPTIDTQIPVTKPVPVFDAEKCTGCRKCVDFCRFNALAMIKGKIFIQESLCHGCGGCLLVCDQGAVTEKNLEIGHIDVGHYHELTVRTGWMNVLEEAASPIIETMLEKTPAQELNLIDCPPGASCSVMACVDKGDYAVIVAEATLYGLENMQMIIELLETYHKPFGIVLNQTTLKANPVKDYLVAHNLTILGEIPYDSMLANYGSNARLAVIENSSYRKLFTSILNRIREENPAWNG